MSVSLVLCLSVSLFPKDPTAGKGPFSGAPSAFLNHVTNFLLNFQFFFLSSMAAMYCYWVPCW